MERLGTVESTLFVPMLGRIYTSENFPNILYDEKALELKEKLPKEVTDDNTQNQYTYLASASRSVNMDRYIKNFLKRHSTVTKISAMLKTGKILKMIMV